jgi:tellurite resistance protein TerC
VILGLLVLDLMVISRKSHEVKFKEALWWSLFWIGLALLFYIFIYFFGHLIHGIDTPQELEHKIAQYHTVINLDGLTFEQGLQRYRENLALEYITGWLIEKSLSVDNLFVMIMIFFSFGVDVRYYHKVLFWGILGAIVMRFIFIFGSAALIQQFDWILAVFGAFLLYTGAKMFIQRNKEENTFDVAKHPVVKFCSKYFRTVPYYENDRFFVRKDNKRYLTPLFIVLLVIEFSDVIFATDSIPAIFSVTKDPYIIFFSNIFAILGLRALFFLVLKVMKAFHFLKHGLAILLFFIGLKLIVEEFFHSWLEYIGFETIHSLYVVLGILTISILASVIFPQKKKDPIE